ncbi:uncharacterized protein LOC135306578 isoform X2 [Passer domesticus]|uniref:uncharacterized protein LOC135306578 isoform X2 n=1 Tax=Passer domesticus TaxID=48849 RepID=UPI0030FF2B15
MLDCGEIKNLKVTSWNFFIPRSPCLGNAATRSVPSGAVEPTGTGPTEFSVHKITLAWLAVAECRTLLFLMRLPGQGQSCMWKVSVQNRILGKNAPLLGEKQMPSRPGLWFACRAAVTAPHFAAWMGCNGVDVHSKTALGISEQTSHTWALSLCRELDFLHDSSFMSESVRPDRQTSFDLGDLSTTILELRTVSPFITLDFGYEE